MGPELVETTGAERRSLLRYRGQGPWMCSARAFPKPLIYSISLMAGQTWAYDFVAFGRTGSVAGLPRTPNEKVSLPRRRVTLNCEPMVTCVIVLGRLERTHSGMRATLGRRR